MCDKKTVSSTSLEQTYLGLEWQYTLPLFGDWAYQRRTDSKLISQRSVVRRLTERKFVRRQAVQSLCRLHGEDIGEYAQEGRYGIQNQTEAETLRIISATRSRSTSTAPSAIAISTIIQKIFSLERRRLPDCCPRRKENMRRRVDVQSNTFTAGARAEGSKCVAGHVADLCRG